MTKENTSFFFPFSFIIFLSSLFLINLQPVSCLRLTLLFTCRLRLPLGGEDVPFLFIDDDEVEHLFLWGGSAWTTQLPVRNGSFCDVISGLIPPFLSSSLSPKLKKSPVRKKAILKAFTSKMIEINFHWNVIYEMFYWMEKLINCSVDHIESV